MFGNSPDETAYCRLMLNRETTPEAMLMLQPTLYSFSFAGPPEPVLLDVSSIAPGAPLGWLLTRGLGVWLRAA